MQQKNDFYFETSSVLSRDTPAERSPVMTCLVLALTAQLICVSGQTISCADNSAIAQLLGVPACTRTERSRSNDEPSAIDLCVDDASKKVFARIRLDEAEKSTTDGSNLFTPSAGGRRGPHERLPTREGHWGPASAALTSVKHLASR
jgi:hypothetical protein